MEKKMKKLLCLVLTLMVGFSTSAYAGTQIFMQEFKNGKATKDKTTISVQDNKLRLDNKKKNRSKSSQVIFDVKQKEILIINHNDKTYTKMDETFFKEVNKKILDAKKQMDEQLAKMPPEQREMMKGMMEKMMGSVSEKQEIKVTNFKKTSRTGQYAGYDCKIVEAFIDNKKIREYCVTPVSDIKGGQEIFTAMKGMSSTFEELYKTMSQSFPKMMEANPFLQIDKLKDYPIAITEFDGSKKLNSNQLISIQSKSFDEGYFLPPKDYKEKALDAIYKK